MESMTTDALELYCRNLSKAKNDLTEYDRALLMDVSARLCELQSRAAEDDKAREEGRSEKLALAMRAGARAIDQSKRLSGATYCYDVFGERGEPKEISYYEAANILRQAAEAALGGGEGG